MAKSPIPSHTRQNGQTVVETPSCGEEPKLDPRVRRTRKLLEDALRDLMHERPYGEISVGEIAERATVNRATFYAHFEDKGHLASTMMNDDLTHALLVRLQPPAEFAPETLIRAATGLFEFVARVFGGCRRHSDDGGASIGTILQESLEGFLRRWLEMHPEGMRRFPGVSPDAVSNVLSWGLYGAAVRWTRLAQRPPVDEAAAEAVALLMR